MSKARELAELGAVYDSGALSNRNLIINGAMQVAQRGTSVTAKTGSAYNCCDRFFTETSGATYDCEQSTNAPDGFYASQKVTADGAFSPTTGQYLIPFEYRMEGNDLQKLAYGTSSAKTMTISFWIKSNKTGTYTVDFVNANSSQARGWAQAYTIDAADTWEYKTLVYTGDTAYAFDTGPQSEFTIFWWMVAGSTYTSGTLATSWENQTSANRAVGVPSSCADDDYWQITGVQLEIGSEATPFEHKSMAQEIMLCSRYFSKEAIVLVPASYYNYRAHTAGHTYRTPMRATPTVTVASGQTGASSNVSGYSTGTNKAINSINYNTGVIQNSSDAWWTGAIGGVSYVNSATTFSTYEPQVGIFTFDAEL